MAHNALTGELPAFQRAYSFYRLYVPFFQIFQINVNSFLNDNFLSGYIPDSLTNFILVAWYNKLLPYVLCAQAIVAKTVLKVQVGAKQTFHALIPCVRNAKMVVLTAMGALVQYFVDFF